MCHLDPRLACPSRESVNLKATVYSPNPDASSPAAFAFPGSSGFRTTSHRHPRTRTVQPQSQALSIKAKSCIENLVSRPGSEGTETLQTRKFEDEAGHRMSVLLSALEPLQEGFRSSALPVFGVPCVCKDVQHQERLLIIPLARSISKLSWARLRVYRRLQYEPGKRGWQSRSLWRQDGSMPG